MKHRTWNPKSFFRELTPEAIDLLAAKYNVSLSREPGDEGPDPAYRAFASLPPPTRQRVERELGPVNDLSGKHARSYLAEVAKEVWPASRVEESYDWSAQDLAVRLFVEHPARLLHEYQRYAFDTMDHLTEYRGKHPIELEASPSKKKLLEEAVQEFFRKTAGGAQCKVEDFEGRDKFAVHIRHEDEVTPTERFESGEIVAVWERPVARAALIFLPETCTLQVKPPRKADAPELRDMFARIFIGEPGFFEDEARVAKFNFDPLRREDMAFPVAPGLPIESVWITKLVVKAPGPSSHVRRLSIEFAPDLTMEGIARALEDRALDLEKMNIDGAQLMFTFSDSKGALRSRQRTVSLYAPNRTNLNDTPRDRMIRRCLKEWGIDASAQPFALAPPPARVA